MAIAQGSDVRQAIVAAALDYHEGWFEGEQGAVEQDLGGERPGDQQRDHQPGDAAAHGGQPQRPGEYGPGPRPRRHRILEVGSCRQQDPSRAVRDRYGPDPNQRS